MFLKKNEKTSIVLMVFSTFATGAAQIFMKEASRTFRLNFISVVSNVYIWGALVLFAMSAGLIILALRGGELSKLYPLVALNFVWVIVASVFLFNEIITGLKVAGIVLIIIGMVVLNRK